MSPAIPVPLVRPDHQAPAVSPASPERMETTVMMEPPVLQVQLVPQVLVVFLVCPVSPV